MRLRAIALQREARQRKASERAAAGLPGSISHGAGDCVSVLPLFEALLSLSSGVLFVARRSPLAVFRQSYLAALLSEALPRGGQQRHFIQTCHVDHTVDWISKFTCGFLSPVSPLCPKLPVMPRTVFVYMYPAILLP